MRMVPQVRYKRLKELWFRKPDGEVEALPVPAGVDQSLLREAVASEYFITTMATSRTIAESEVCVLRSGGDVVGYLIPGQTILSDDQPMNSDRLYGTYSLLTAMNVCKRSHEQDYKLSGYSIGSDRVFIESIFYLIVWLKPLKTAVSKFSDEYFVSLASYGLYPYIYGKRPTPSQRTLPPRTQKIQLTKNRIWPDYVRTIISELEPYSADPFLRFFYLYQVIEILMSANYKDRLTEVRQSFDAINDLSITQLREFVEKFQRIYREKPRIKEALSPVCPESKRSAEALLSAIGETVDLATFGELIYKVRNIIFHEYQRAHPHASLVADLEDNLLSYILEKKLGAAIK